MLTWVWVDMWYKKKKLADPLPLQIQHLSHPHSVFVSVSHSLSLSHKPPSSYALPFLPVFSLRLQYFLFGFGFFSIILFLSVLLLLLSCLFSVFSDIHQEGSEKEL